ncbi:MAG: FtsX-like permease family protein, partial [Rectinema sp.]|nr:FtsX-like permease family protein [Rectinema sp.]
SILILIMALAIIIAVINLASALTTFVTEHRTEIAILRSFGASTTQTAQIFLLGGAVTGAIGCIAGSVAGIAISMYINEIIRGLEIVIQAAAALFGNSANHIRLLNPDYYLERIPIAIDWPAVAIINAAGLLLSALASLIPASKSAEIAPAELIRRE